MILDITHVALQVPDLDTSVDFAVDTLGMHEVERVGRRAYLTLESPYPSLSPVCGHHVVEYVEGPDAALDHVGFLVDNVDALDLLVARAEAAGGATLPHDPDEPGLGEAIRLAAPSGHVFELHTEMADVSCSYVPRGLRPHRLGHVNFLARDAPGLMQFLVDGLGFLMSDWVTTADGPQAGFARCNTDHHTVGAIASPVDGLHHIAFETSSSGEIERLGDHLARAGRQYSWGPGRHGAGDNIAAYLFGPDGIMIEIYADMQRIIGDSWEPRSWTSDDPRVLNMWTGAAGSEAFTSSIPLADAARGQATR